MFKTLLLFWFIPRPIDKIISVSLKVVREILNFDNLRHYTCIVRSKTTEYTVSYGLSIALAVRVLVRYILA